jgi:hypothetical protein
MVYTSPEQLGCRMQARLTIAIPTLNRAGLLVRALESVLAQTTDEIEILVSDNGSSDETPAVLARYNDPRLRKMRCDSTISRSDHGVLIYSKITTEFVLVLSDDDFLEPDFAAEVLKLFAEHPALSFVYTGCYEHYDDAQLVAAVGPEIEDSRSFFLAHFGNQRQVSWCAAVTRIADMRRFGPQPDNCICGDMFFWTQIAFLGPVGCVARPLAHYVALRPDGDNESRSTPIIAWAEDVRRIQSGVLQRMHAQGADASYCATLAGNMRRYLFGSLSNQFLWARISGMRRWDCVKQLPYIMRERWWNLGGMARIGAAIILSRRMLRGLVVWNARRLDRQRRMKVDN